MGADGAIFPPSNRGPLWAYESRKEWVVEHFRKVARFCSGELPYGQGQFDLWGQDLPTSALVNNIPHLLCIVSFLMLMLMLMIHCILHTLQCTVYTPHFVLGVL